MSYNERKVIYEKIEQLRNRPLMAYITSLRSNAAGQMAMDVVAEFARQILAIGDEFDKVDVLIISNGGDPTVAWRVISMLRERFNEVGVLLPYTAFSAATLLALGGNEIIMHPLANLGPVDPQLTIARPESAAVQHIGSEDLAHFLAFVREDVGITNQQELQSSFELLCRDIGAIAVGAAKRSTQLSLSLGERLLNLHMDDRNEAKAIAESLNRSFFHHGYPVGRREAKKIGLPIKESDKEIESLLWQVWQSIEKEMLCNKPFNPISELFANSRIASILGPVKQIQIPSNLPQPLINDAYSQALQRIQVVDVPSLDYDLFIGTLESVRCKSDCKVKGKLSAVRRPDMSFAVNTSTIAEGWTFVEN